MLCLENHLVNVFDNITWFVSCILSYNSQIKPDESAQMFGCSCSKSVYIYMFVKRTIFCVNENKRWVCYYDNSWFIVLFLNFCVMTIYPHVLQVGLCPVIEIRKLFVSLINFFWSFDSKKSKEIEFTKPLWNKKNDFSLNNNFDLDVFYTSFVDLVSEATMIPPLNMNVNSVENRNTFSAKCS